MTCDQLMQTVASSQQAPDAELAQKLAGLELSERLSNARLAELTGKLPGEKSHMVLLMLADQSVFLPPPADEIPADAAPDAAATRQMLVKIVNYVNTTVHQLPNLMATRFTNGFEDRPREERLTSTGIVSLDYLPLRWVGSMSVDVTYRDRKEVEDSKVKAKKAGSGVGGLVTTGEFGPILSTVVADALKGKITWARWEKSAGGTQAVLHYAVGDDKSNYRVQFCCIVNGYATDGSANREIFNERAAYHGDIVFNPADGSIRLLTLQADMPHGGLVAAAGMAVEYAATDIGGRRYICPVKSVSMLQAHTAQQSGAFSRSDYKGATKTFLNDVAFSGYRRFGSEVKILADSSGE
ncbi:MAG TPA: hypothetical protein VG267_08330 [Terracidiphilus sp.]|nr:hypothetical protein [Terracidiphilus sp.]